MAKKGLSFDGAPSVAAAVDHAAVTPSDSADLTQQARALFVGTGGNIAISQDAGSTSVIYKNVASGTVLPVAAKRVMATSTTATDIVALY